MTATADFDIAILGSGPIGTLTAFNLSQKTALRCVIVSREPEIDYTATYVNAGGSIRTYWDDAAKTEATMETTAFIRDEIAKGADFDLVDNGYLFLNRGVKVPAINVAGAKLLRHVLQKTLENGLERIQAVAIDSVRTEDGQVVVEASGEVIRAKKAVLALGAANGRFLSGLDLEIEKRQLYVLDLPVDEDRAGLPHTIVPVGHGVVYVFIKKIGGKPKLVLGEEGFFEHSLAPEPEDNFAELVSHGLTERLPFLKGASVERIMWGFDATNKLPAIGTTDGLIYTANCGSAVRSSAYIGRKTAEAVAG